MSPGPAAGVEPNLSDFDVVVAGQQTFVQAVGSVERRANEKGRKASPRTLLITREKKF